MLRHAKPSRFQIVSAWCLCCLLFAVALFAPNCPYCDEGFSVANGTAHVLAAHPAAQPDGCSGACSCCGFQLLAVTHRITVEVTMLPHIASPVMATRLNGWDVSPLRPPRG